MSKRVLRKVKPNERVWDQVAMAHVWETCRSGSDTAVRRIWRECDARVCVCDERKLTVLSPAVLTAELSIETTSV